MKKIVFIHLLNDYSGSPKVLSQVINVVRSKNIGVALYTAKGTNGFLSNITKNHYYIAYKRFENKYLTLVSFLLSQTILFFKLLKYYRKDITIYVNTMLPFGAALAGKLMGKTIIYHIHETSITPKLFKKFLQKIIQLTATKIIYVSHTLKQLEPYKNIPNTVIYNVLPQHFFEQNKTKQLPKYPENFNVYMVCSLKAYKGINEFVYVAQQCVTHTNLKFTLILNATTESMNLYFKNINLPNNLTLLPSQTTLNIHYNKAHLLLNLSKVNQWVETFGLTILEAMSFGIPVIVPPVGGPAEIVTQHKEGYLINAEETTKIIDTILKVSKQKELYESLSKNALKRSLDFNPLMFNKKIIETLEYN